MMRQFKYLFYILRLFVLFFVAIPLTTHSVTPYYSVRTQSLAWPRIVGMTHYINLNKESWYGTFDVTFGYMQTFRNKDIVKCLFGKDSLPYGCDCPFITITGSRHPERNPQDWLADYFGLPTDFKSQVYFRPVISNFIVDFNTYIGLDACVSGLYLEIHAPLVHTKWGLRLRENVILQGDLDYDAGYFSTVINPEHTLVQNFTSYVANFATPRLNQPLIDAGVSEETLGNTGVVFEPLRYSRMTYNSTATRFSDIYFILGWNMIECDDYYFGLNARVAAPAGTRTRGIYLFEPIIGNGHHWELGGGMTAYTNLCRSEEDDFQLNFYLDGFISHLFKTKQVRSFDLTRNGPNSRYMLAEKLGTPVVNLFSNELEGNQAGSTAPSAQFKNIFTPVANLTTVCADVGIKLQGEVTALINVHCHNVDFDFGYRFWGRSCERICIPDACGCKCPEVPLSRAENVDVWALKGDAHVYGFLLGNVPGVGVTNQPIALSGTQSTATIHHGTNNFNGLDGNNGGINNIRPTRNPGVDNAQFARATAGATGVAANILDRTIGNGGLQTKTSNEPVFFNTEDMNIDAARTGGRSHTVFANLSYSWYDWGQWYPYLGLGGKLEFAPRPCDLSCCPKCNPSEWGIWFKGGVAFN